jgi:hypothetical protein
MQGIERTTQRGVIEMAPTQLKERRSERFLWRCREGIVERGVDLPNDEVLVKHEKGLVEGVHDSLCIRRHGRS